jgi:hypothetical protein
MLGLAEVLLSSICEKSLAMALRNQMKTLSMPPACVISMATNTKPLALSHQGH